MKIAFIIPGRIAEIVILIIICILVVLSIIRARGGYTPKIRRMSALEAIPEAIGRTVETGRPLLFSLGMAGLYETRTPQTLAGISVLTYVARQMAELEAPFIIGIKSPELIPLCDEIVSQAYIEAGKPGLFNKTETIRFVTNNIISAAAGIMGILERERCAAHIFIGALFAETIMFAETGNRIGAIQIAGTDTTHQMAFVVAACDYSLIGEEIYAAGAYVSDDPILLGSIRGQDISKVIMTILMLLGCILVTFNIDLLVNLLKM